MATKRYDPSNTDLRTGKPKQPGKPTATVKPPSRPTPTVVVTRPQPKPAPKPVATAARGAGIREAITATQRRERDAGT